MCFTQTPQEPTFVKLFANPKLVRVLAGEENHRLGLIPMWLLTRTTKEISTCMKKYLITLFESPRGVLSLYNLCRGSRDNPISMNHEKEWLRVHIDMKEWIRVHMWCHRKLFGFDISDSPPSREDIEDIPEDHWTPDLVLLAISKWQMGLIVNSVPASYKTLDVCIAAIQRDLVGNEFVPEKHNTPKLWMAVVRKEGSKLQMVPEEMRTPEICNAALTNEWWALKHVPVDLQTLELCKALVKTDPCALYYMHKKRKTPAFCEWAVQENPWTLQYVPSDQRTAEFYKIALRKNPEVIEKRPKRQKLS